MTEGLQKDAERKCHSASKQRERQEKLGTLGQMDAIKTDSQNNQQHRQANPVAVGIYLAVVNIFCLPVAVERGLHRRRVAIRGCRKARGQ